MDISTLLNDGSGGKHDDRAAEHPPQQRYRVATLRGATQVIIEPSIAICLGQQVQRIPQSRFLQHVWGTGLDSECHECGNAFDPDHDTSESMIRTIAFEKSETTEESQINISQVPVTANCIRIYNRHFKCIKERAIRYIPISHPWHERVSTFQNNRPPPEESRHHDFEVARNVYQTPLRTLEAVSRRFGNAEIWHDYLSVPQWQNGFQQQLLSAIPEIYSWPLRMVIHLDDVSVTSLFSLQKNSDYEAFLKGLSEVTRSRWFERMWVTVEYIKGREVSILTKDWNIFEKDAADILGRVDAAVVRYIKQKGDAGFHDDANEKGCRWNTKVCWTDMESWKMRTRHYATLGAAVYILGQKKCRDRKDYHYAVAGMLGFTILKWRDKFCDSERFLHLARACLKQGDYTPLLFTPISGETAYPQASWLRGHSQMTEKVWDLGACHSRADDLEIMQGGMVCPELQEVGVVERWGLVDLDGDPKVLFRATVRWALRVSGTSASAFCNAIDRIFPPFERKGLYGGRSVAGLRGPNLSAYEMNRIRDTLQRLQDLIDGCMQEVDLDLYIPSAEEETDELVQSLIDRMGLDRRDRYSADSRLHRALGEMEWYRKQSGSTFDGVAQVRCKSCRQQSLFRLICWTKPKRRVTEVWRIPGLLFDETVPDGVGLVITNGVITGKMSYGTPACDCREFKRVNIV